MRKTVLIPLVVLTVATFVSAGLSLAAAKHGEKVSVKLSAVPKVKTAAKGAATFELGKDGSAIHYKLHVDKLENATMGHIHEVGDDGTPAAILVWLYPTTGESPSLREGKLTGTLAEGEITADKLGGPLKGKTVKELFEELEYGKAGVAVHTKQNPGGELWGVHKGKEHKKM